MAGPPDFKTTTSPDLKWGILIPSKVALQHKLPPSEEEIKILPCAVLYALMALAAIHRQLANCVTVTVLHGGDGV